MSNDIQKTTSQENILIDPNRDDYFKIKMEKCLEDIKNDLKYLPCQYRGTECPQEARITNLKEKITNMQQDVGPLGQEQTAHGRTLESLIEMIGDLGSKLDAYKHEAIEAKLEHTKEMAQLRLELATQLQGIIVARDTKTDTKDRIMEAVKFAIGAAVGGTVLYAWLATFAG